MHVVACLCRKVDRAIEIHSLCFAINEGMLPAYNLSALLTFLTAAAPNVCRQVDEAELAAILSAAVICTILAAAGPQRSRMLATLYKVRGHKWEVVHYETLLLSNIVAASVVATDAEPC